MEKLRVTKNRYVEAKSSKTQLFKDSFNIFFK